MNKNRLTRYPKPVFRGIVRPELALFYHVSHRAQMHKAGALDIFIDRAPDMGWHMVVVHPSKVPDLDEVMALRVALLPPGILAALILPASEKEYFMGGSRVDVWEIVRADQMLEQALESIAPSPSRSQPEPMEEAKDVAGT